MASPTAPGWLSLVDSAAYLGTSYETLRRLASSGVFTQGKFSSAEKRPPIFLRRAELNAFRTGGVEAVKRTQKRRGRKCLAK